VDKYAREGQRARRRGTVLVHYSANGIDWDWWLLVAGEQNRRSVQTQRYLITTE
jgi:hypothetical protein